MAVLDPFRGVCQYWLDLIGMSLVASAVWDCTLKKAPFSLNCRMSDAWEKRKGLQPICYVGRKTDTNFFAPLAPNPVMLASWRLTVAT